MCRLILLAWPVALLIGIAQAQQQCYFGAGSSFRGPSELVPCNPSGASACCLLGDVCLSGSACYDPDTGDTYQYGCTDISYNDATCPYKCGFDPGRSPWTAITQCSDVSGVSDTWVCHGPESCGCEWRGPTYDMLVLQPRSCQAMGDEALVALQAPPELAPYISLPSTAGGSTGYFSFFTTDGTATWVSTAVPSYTPSPATQLTSYSVPTTSEFVDRNASPDSATYAPASFLDGSLPSPGTIVGGSTVPVNTAQPTQSVPSSSTSTSASESSSSSSSSTSPSTSGQLASDSTPTTTQPNPAVATTAGGGGGGLSTGAKAGIGVGVALGVIIIIGLIIAIIVMRRRHISELHNAGQTRPSEIEDPYIQEGGGGAVTADAKTRLKAEEKDEKGGVHRPETMQPLELPNTERNTIYELESPLAELSARTSVRGSPRTRNQVNSNGSVFTEEGLK